MTSDRPPTVRTTKAVKLSGDVVAELEALVAAL
jgi:hypothetical protein